MFPKYLKNTTNNSYAWSIKSTANTRRYRSREELENQEEKMSLTILTPTAGFSGEYEKRVPVPCMEELTINVMGERITLWVPEESTSPPHLDEFLEDCVRPRPGSLLWDLCDAVGFFGVGKYDPIELHTCMSTRDAIGGWRTLDQQYLDFHHFAGCRATLDDNFKELHEFINDDEHAEAYDKWVASASNMDDLHGKSLFTEWNQGTGSTTYVGADELSGKNACVIPEYTPEMLVQRDNLNWCFNFVWNNPHYTSIPEEYPQVYEDVPNRVELLEIVNVGENYSIAKSGYGAVYIPKAAMNYLNRNGGCEVGAKLEGEIGFTRGRGTFHWRLLPNGVTYTYAE